MIKSRPRTDRITAAARAAAAADGWLLPSAVQSRLDEGDLCQNAKALERKILGSERLSRRVFDPLPRLFDLFRQHSDLGQWLYSPDKARSLCLFAGARRHGGALRGFIDRRDVETIVSRIGWPAYRYGLERQHAALVMSTAPDPILDAIEYDGVNAVSRYLGEVLGDLYPDVARAAGLPETPPSKTAAGASGSIDVTAVMSEVEHEQFADPVSRRPAKLPRSQAGRGGNAPRQRQQPGERQPH